MEHTIVQQQDEKYLRFIEYLKRLSKDELIDLIGEFWFKLKINAEKGMTDEKNYLVKEMSGVKLTQANHFYASTFQKVAREKPTEDGKC